MEVTNNGTSKHISKLFHHPSKLVILLSLTEHEKYTVIYRNPEASHYFSADTENEASKFFGKSWHKIIPLLQEADELLPVYANAEWTKNGEEDCFKVFIQCREDGVIYMEMMPVGEVLKHDEQFSDLYHKYSSVTHLNIDPILIVQKDFTIQYVNQAIFTSYGYNPTELYGTSLLSYFDKSDQKTVGNFIHRVLQGKALELDNVAFSHRNGDNLPTYLKAVPIVRDGSVEEIHLVIRNTSSFHENSRQLIYISNHDQLTGLWNRSSMKEHFSAMAKSKERNLQQISLLHIGLDRFKLINESIGTVGADDILKLTAARLQAICPPFVRLYRKGGDEFIFLMNEASGESAEGLAQVILHDFTKPYIYDEQEFFVSASIGIAMYPKDGKTLDDLLQVSGKALQYVKKRCRSQYRFYTNEMKSSFPDEAVMESHLRRAIELNELSIHYQPQIDLRTGKISSFEALLRWNNRKFGQVSPARFIPILEESGLIHEIGDWVLDSVCRQLKEWKENNYQKVRIAVNISPQQFKLETFVEKVKDHIIRYGIEPSSIEVEITESSLSNINDTIQTLRELKKIGVYIAVDDFGTGYSSLSYLKQYPIDIIKIDRSFIMDIESDIKNAAIAKTIINLAHNLGMDVIAEGVEKELQAQILLEANCFKAQGFLYSKAISAKDITERYFTETAKKNADNK